MIPIRPTSRTLAALMVCLLAIGLWQLGEGSWIYAKARLAQWLLMRAWSHTLAGAVAPKPWPWADTWPVARLTVPAKQVDLIVLNGAYARTLAFGPGYWEGSTLSDSIGTTILTGHRDTHFAFLKTLRPGDHIMLQTRTGHPRSYRVRDLQVVDYRTARVWFNPDDNALILVTCYPFDRLIPGGPLRYVVIAAAVYNGNERHDGRHQARSTSDRDGGSITQMVANAHRTFFSLILISMGWLLVLGCSLLDWEHAIAVPDVNSEENGEKNLEAIRAMQADQHRENPAAPSNPSDIAPSGSDSKPQSMTVDPPLQLIPATQSPAAPLQPTPSTPAKLPWSAPTPSRSGVPERTTPAYTIPAPVGPDYAGSSRCVPDGMGGQRCLAH